MTSRFGVEKLDEAKALVDVTNHAIESLNNGFSKKEFEDMDGSPSQMAEMMAWNNDFMMDMIAADLDEKYGRVEEVRGGNGWESAREINLIENFNFWRKTVGKATNNDEIQINGSVNQGGSNSVNSTCPRSQGSNTNQMVPSSKSLENTFSPNQVLDFLELAARQPRRVGELLPSEKQVELAAYNGGNRKRKHSSSATPSIGG